MRIGLVFPPYKHKIPYEIKIADNMYLALLSETGILGFLGFLIWLLKKGLGKLKTLNFNYQAKLQLLVSLMAFIGLLVNMAGYDLFYGEYRHIISTPS